MVSEEVLPGVIADFDPEGLLVGFEIMDASKFGDYSEFILFLSKWGDEEKGAGRRWQSFRFPAQEQSYFRGRLSYDYNRTNPPT